MSHTSTVKVEYKDQESLAAAIRLMGGEVLGLGLHELYAANPEFGFGFTLPGWQYPLVLRENMSLAYDDYKGHWGNVEDLATLKGRYTIECARTAAEAQGWVCENQADGNLLIYHPEGGTLTVTPEGEVDLCAFQGVSCVEAGNVIEQALGQVLQTVNKPELFVEQVRLTQS